MCANKAMYRTARRSLAIFALAVVCVTGTNALRTTMTSGGVVPSGGEASRSAGVGSSSAGLPLLAADVGVVTAASAATADAADAGVGIANGEGGLMGTTAAKTSAVAAKNVVDR